MENSRNYIATSEVITVEDYPYGFRLRTTLFDTMELDAKKGYRHVTQTINPKNGVLNKPKKSTYYSFMVRFYDENQHVKCNTFEIRDTESMNRTAKFLFENFKLFSALEIENIKLNFLAGIKVSVYAKAVYKGASMEDLKPFFTPIAKVITDSLKDKQNENIFDKIIFDEEAIEKTFIKDFDPFTVKESFKISEIGN